MTGGQDQAWLTMVHGVASDAQAEARVRQHWKGDAALLADAIAQVAPTAQAPLFHVAVRDFDRLFGAA